MSSDSSIVILLVDDDQYVLDMLRRCFEMHGQTYTLLVASGGEEAFRSAQNFQGRIDLLLSDVRMPGMDGIALARAVKEKRPEIQVILMSGDSESVVRSKGFTVLTKPFAMGALIQTIRNLLALTQREPAC